RGEQRTNAVERFTLLFNRICQTRVGIHEGSRGPAMLRDEERNHATGEKPGQNRVLELDPDIHGYLMMRGTANGRASFSVDRHFRQQGTVAEQPSGADD